MPSFPGSLSSLTTGVTDSNDAAAFHAQLHNDTNAEVNAIESTLGVNPQGAYSDVAARIAAVASAAGGTVAVHTLNGAHAESATTVTLDRNPGGWVATGRTFYLLIGVGTGKCQVRKVTGISGAVVTLDQRLWWAHSNGELVVFWPHDNVPAGFWGAKFDQSTDDTNALQSAVTQSSLYGGPWITGASTNQATGIAQAVTSRPLVVTSHGRLRRAWLKAAVGFTGADAAKTAMVQSSNHPLCTVTGDATTDTFTVSQSMGGTGVNAGDQVMFVPTGDVAALPGGITAGTVYYSLTTIASVNVGQTFQVSATSGGAAVNITSNGSAIFLQKIDGVGRPYLEDVQVDGSSVTNLNGFRLATQQPFEGRKLRADACYIGFLIDDISQQGRFYNTQCGTCTIGYQVDGNNVQFDYCNPEDCGTGMLIRGDVTEIGLFHGERNTREIILDGTVGGTVGSSRATVIKAGHFAGTGATANDAPIYLTNGAESFNLYGAYFVNAAATGRYLVYDNGFANHVMFEETAGTNAVVGHITKPAGIQKAVVIDRFYVDKNGGFSWLRSPSGTEQRPNASAAVSLLFSGSGVPSNAVGSNGDFYFRVDTPGTANQRLYVKSAGAWAGIL